MCLHKLLLLFLKDFCAVLIVTGLTAQQLVATSAAAATLTASINLGYCRYVIFCDVN